LDDSPPVSDGVHLATIVTGAVTSIDPAFAAPDGSTIEYVVMQNQNNDAPGFVVQIVAATSPPSPGHGHDQFTLLSQPTAPVTIPLSISDATRRHP